MDLKWYCLKTSKMINNQPLQVVTSFFFDLSGK
jgi:hypothetical protein